MAKSILDMSAEEMRRQTEVNMVGLTLCAKEAINQMRQNGVDDGHVINVCQNKNSEDTVLLALQLTPFSHVHLELHSQFLHMLPCCHVDHFTVSKLRTRNESHESNASRQENMQIRDSPWL